MRFLMLPAIDRFLGGLRFRWLFLIAVVVFTLDLFTPDLVPGMPVDEILLAVVTIVLARWKKRRSPEAPEAPAPPATPRDVIDLPRDSVRREG